jgi:tetratricopeptide (TPR) repeat protein
VRWPGGLALLFLLASGPAEAQEPPPIWKACGAATTAGAIEACTTIIDARRAQKDVSLALRLRAQAYQVKREFDRAFRDYAEALGVDPRHLEVYVSRSRLYTALGQHDRAVQDCETALRLRPGFVPALYGRGRANFYKGEFARSLPDIEAALKIEPSAVHYTGRCSTRVALDALEGAVADCTEALKLWPTFTFALNGRGAAYLKLGEFDKALDDFEASLRSEPDNSFGLFGRGIARLKMGDREGGRDDMARAKQLDPAVDPHFRHLWHLDL